MEKSLTRFFFSLAPLWAAAAYCPGLHGAERGLLHNWVSSTHVGFATEGESTTGFRNAAGSLLFIDLSKAVAKNLSLGLRTAASGAQGGPGEFVRLGAGPLLGFHITKSWVLELAASFFKESAVSGDGEDVYSSQGQAVQIGWHRHIPLGKRLEISWGGFFGRHWGDIKPSPNTSSSKSLQNPQPASGRNIGASRGIEIALRIRL